MNRLAYLAAMALLGVGLTLEQNTKPSSDPSNSSNTSSQAQSATSTPNSTEKAPDAVPSPNHRRDQGEPSTSAVPDPTVRDQQGSTMSTTDAAGQNNSQPSPSTMGTTGSTPATSDQTSKPKRPATMLQNGTPPDQQPNSSTGPDAASPHAELTPTPATRAASTHTPDPGTCMNPAALPASADGSPPNNTPRCR
jgi:hypothetical protein